MSSGAEGVSHVSRIAHPAGRKNRYRDLLNFFVSFFLGVSAALRETYLQNRRHERQHADNE